ncbi:hypothetical protein ElyMa_000502900 [Elysia marginata]|uniref:Uncharacterized protein n=1 Tax=Elysia marginata TaxID=1093978 RepID=A0AAV4FWU2_9GAST|nr:hypothetical protein ElyMa_000502900 [Elysia marginata]
MPQQTSAFEACSWVTLLQVGGLGKVRVNCIPMAIATWYCRESNPRPPDLESDPLTTPPRCPVVNALLLKKVRVLTGADIGSATICCWRDSKFVLLKIGKDVKLKDLLTK